MGHNTSLRSAVSLLCLLMTVGVNCAPRVHHGFNQQGPFWGPGVPHGFRSAPGGSLSCGGSALSVMDPACGTGRPSLGGSVLGSWPLPSGLAFNFRFDPSRLMYYRYSSADPQLPQSERPLKQPGVVEPSTQLEGPAFQGSDFEFELLRYEPTPGPAASGVPATLTGDPNAPVLRELEVLRYSSSRPVGQDPVIRRLMPEDGHGLFGMSSWFPGAVQTPFGWPWGPNLGEPVQTRSSMQRSRVLWSQPSVAHTVITGTTAGQPWPNQVVRSHQGSAGMRGVGGAGIPPSPYHLNLWRPTTDSWPLTVKP
ncbi:hypothetical protein GN956_G4189 [Arapaima gigas]